MEMLRHYAAYNLWANRIISDFLKAISADNFSKDMGNSFSSIQKTVLHIYGGERIWLGRIQGDANAPFPFFDTLPSQDESLDLWINTSLEFSNFLKECQDDFAEKEISYNRLDEVHRTEAKWIIHHIMNHSTFHRGQIITMLRQLGYDNLPMTDFIKYQRLL